MYAFQLYVGIHTASLINLFFHILTGVQMMILSRSAYLSAKSEDTSHFLYRKCAEKRGVEELVRMFIDNEEQNFLLFTYANLKELQNETASAKSQQKPKKGLRKSGRSQQGFLDSRK